MLWNCDTLVLRLNIHAHFTVAPAKFLVQYILAQRRQGLVMYLSAV